MWQRRYTVQNLKILQVQTLSNSTFVFYFEWTPKLATHICTSNWLCLFVSVEAFWRNLAARCFFLQRLSISQLKLCWLVLVMIHPKKCGFSWPKSLTSFGCRISTTDAEFPSKLRQISFETTHCWMTHVSTEVFKTFARLYLCFLMCFAGQISLLHVQLPVLLPNVLIRNYLKNPVPMV